MKANKNKGNGGKGKGGKGKGADTSAELNAGAETGTVDAGTVDAGTAENGVGETVETGTAENGASTVETGKVAEVRGTGRAIAEVLAGETLDGGIVAVVRRHGDSTGSKVEFMRRLLMTAGETKQSILAKVRLRADSTASDASTLNTVRADLMRTQNARVLATGWRTDGRTNWKLATSAVAKLRTATLGQGYASKEVVRHVTWRDTEAGQALLAQAQAAGVETLGMDEAALKAALAEKAAETGAVAENGATAESEGADTGAESEGATVENGAEVNA